MSSFRSSFTPLVRLVLLQSIPLYIEGPGLIIDPADRKQLKRSQTQEGFSDQIEVEKEWKKGDGERRGPAFATYGSGLHNCQISRVLKEPAM